VQQIHWKDKGVGLLEGESQKTKAACGKAALLYLPVKGIFEL